MGTKTPLVRCESAHIRCLRFGIWVLGDRKRGWKAKPPAPPKPKEQPSFPAKSRKAHQTFSTHDLRRVFQRNGCYGGPRLASFYSGEDL
jgi:hypothetical protein